MAKRRIVPREEQKTPRVDARREDSIAQRLHAALQEIDRPGTFCTSGSLPAVLPGLEVKKLGPVALPLTAAQAQELKECCEQAPYGKGEKTLVDTTVRRVWRLKPERFGLRNPDWDTFLASVVAKVRENLGLEEEQLQAHLYELLLYDPGSFFLPHRDGEKLDGMVATMVITLPSTHAGGELVVRHEGDEQTIDFSGADSAFRTSYAAFYADCEHEVRPLKSGYRLCLVYNLVLAKSKRKKILAPQTAGHIAKVAGILSDWSDAPSGPRKLAVTMEHRYSQAGLTHLKGVDAARAKVLVAAARAADCQIHAALLTLYQMGEADPGEDPYSSRSRWGWRKGHRQKKEAASQHTMGEIYESHLTAKHWRGPGGERPRFGTLPVEREEIVPEESLTAIQPKEEYEGYTGNEGLTLQRWYHHAALFLWPQARHFEILCGGNGRRAVPALKEMIRAWRRAGEDTKEMQRQQCLQFAEQILLQWPASRHARWDVSRETSETDNPLVSLVCLGDVKLIRQFIAEVLMKDKSLAVNKWIVKAIHDHGWATLRPELSSLVSGSDNETIQRNIRLVDQLGLARLRQKLNAQEKVAARETCGALAEAAVAALLRVDAMVPQYAWQNDGVNRAWLLPRLVRALLASGFEDLLGQILEHVQRDPKHYPLLRVQFPAIKTLSRWLRKNLAHSSIPLTRWIAACRAKLESETAAEPEPPRDFRREFAGECKCADCAELKQFLLDASQAEHRFQMAQYRRDHLQGQISRYRLDLDCKTDRKPRPQILICTKNMATYGRWLKTYRANQGRLKLLRELEEALPG